MNILVFLFAFLLSATGIIFVYAPTWIVRFNKIAREKVFNDALVLLGRRKKGIFFLLNDPGETLQKTLTNLPPHLGEEFLKTFSKQAAAHQGYMEERVWDLPL